MRHIFIIAVGIAILVSGCIGSPSTTNPPIIDKNESINPAIYPADLATLHYHNIFQQYAEANGKNIAETTQFFQQTYGIEEAGIFRQLPTPSEAFEQDVNTLNYGNGLSVNQIPAESYLQPEFYPTFESTGIKTWTQATAPLTNTFGVASTPADQQATLEPDSNGFTTTLFIGSAWGVTYYQGMAFRYVIEPQADIQLTFSPNNILMGPTFPAFTPEWMHKITVDGTIGEDVGEGTYTINIFPADAPIEIQEGWYAEHPRYINGNGLIGPSNGLATFVLTIPPRSGSSS